jgi:ABC-2 type transport system permease protein
LRLRERGRFKILLKKEVRDIFRAKTFWALWLVVAPLVGYGFIQAVRLYAEASRTALKFPDMARGLFPLDGVLVPTLGAYYVAITFLWPFLVIRSLSEEKRNGWIKILLQTSFRSGEIVAGKVVALGVAGILLAVPAFRPSWCGGPWADTCTGRKRRTSFWATGFTLGR